MTVVTLLVFWVFLFSALQRFGGLPTPCCTRRTCPRRSRDTPYFWNMGFPPILKGAVWSVWKYLSAILTMVVVVFVARRSVSPLYYPGLEMRGITWMSGLLSLSLWFLCSHALEVAIEVTHLLKLDSAAVAIVYIVSTVLFLGLVGFFVLTENDVGLVFMDGVVGLCVVAVKIFAYVQHFRGIHVHTTSEMRSVAELFPGIDSLVTILCLTVVCVSCALYFVLHSEVVEAIIVAASAAIMLYSFSCMLIWRCFRAQLQPKHELLVQQ
jgi:hypothetical protein